MTVRIIDPSTKKVRFEGEKEKAIEWIQKNIKREAQDKLIKEIEKQG